MLKIGVFDSGLGGLTVVHALSQIIKGAELFYIADTKNAPYGEKTTEEILDFSLTITQYFIDTYHIDALVVACNTATSAAISSLRKRYPDLIVIGTEPGIKPAIEKTNTGKIGVLATPATLKGDKYKELANKLSIKKNILLYEQACPGLVEQIEKGEIETEKTIDMLKKWLLPMKKEGVDTIVLGCTHYPLVAEVIERIMDSKIEIIQTGHAIAQRLLLLSQIEGHNNIGEFNIRLYTTDKIDVKSIDNILNTTTSIDFISL